MELQWNNQILSIRHCEMKDTDAIFSYLHIAKKTRYLYYQQKRVLLNRKIIHTNTPLNRKDKIEIHTACEPVDETCTPCYDEIHILYEDELLLIVDKPSGMLVHSDGVSIKTTLYDLVKGYYLINGYSCAVRAIHRLDYETSGAVIFCKIPFLQPLLDYMLKEKKIERRYRALCAGTCRKQHFTIDAAIGRDRHHASRMRICEKGKPARTDVTVLANNKDYLYVECQLHQGRTHQIRVHLSSIGHPILHDTLYGNNDSRIMRTALHAYQVILYHPLLKKQLVIECPLPDDIKNLL